MSEAIITCTNVWKLFGPDPQGFLDQHGGAPSSDTVKAAGYIPAVFDANIDVHEGEILVLMGLSGSGKSTLVRCLSRLIEPTAGSITFEGKDLLTASDKEMIEIRRHKMGMVFQHFALLPHRTVLQNVAFPLEVQGIGKDERLASAREILELVGLAGRDHYYPRELSGGQQQRVGIARSLAVEPDVWFLDEPFSALDPLIRKEMQDEFIRLQGQLKKTIVFITHDFDEAIRLADRIAIMYEGRIVQIGTAEELITNPATEYVEKFTQDVSREKLLSVGSVMNDAGLADAAVGAVDADSKLFDVASQVLVDDRVAPVVNGEGGNRRLRRPADNRRRLVRSKLMAASTVPVSAGAALESTTPFWRTFRGRLLIAFAPFVIVQLVKRWIPDLVPDWARALPDGAVPNVSEWINDFTDYLKDDEILGLFNFRQLTRDVAGLMDWPLDFFDGILRTGEGSFGLPAVPWIALVGLSAVLGWYLKGWRLALMSGACVSYLALFGMWDDAMRTLGAVLVAVPAAGLLGFALGLLAAKRRWFEKILVPFLNILQAFPHFSYLLPVVVFVGLTHKAGVVATIFFAFPPMARLTILGIRGIPPEIIEAGEMSGSTPRQMLWKVELPAARRALMVGVNQVIMGCLGMVVIASFIGTNGLGLRLKQALGSLKIGEGLETGIAVVLLAILLDRLSQAWSDREPEHREVVSTFERFKYMYAAGAVVVVTIIIGFFTDKSKIYPDARPILDSAGRTITNADGTIQKIDDWTISFSGWTESVVDWIKRLDAVDSFRDFVSVQILINMHDAFVAVPWVAGLVLVAGVGWALKGPRLAATSSGLVLLLAFSGWWFEAMETLYLVVAAVTICMALGLIIGIWASKSEARVRFSQVVLDTFQTMPSFIYLLPVIMLFSIGPVAALTAMVIYPTVPAIRYTMLGLRGVPEDKIEAARTSGCTERQVLWKVKMPLAVPEILLGLNQTILYTLFMVIIAAFIGGIDGLGRPLFLSLTNSDMGAGIVVGLCVACLGLIPDNLITNWASDRKAQLGLD